MKRMTVLFSALCVVFTLLFTGRTADAAENSIRYYNAKTLGHGDAKIAGGFRYNGFVDNPALLSRVHILRLDLVNIPITINKNLMGIGKFISDNSDNFKNFDDLTIEEKNTFMDDLKEYDAKWGGFNLAPMVNMSLNIRDFGVGLAVFNSTDLRVKMDRGIYEPRVWGEGFSNLAIVLGVAKPLSILYPGLTVGMNVKYLARSRAHLFQIPASDLGNTEDTLDPIIDEVSKPRRTVAVDIGTLWDVPLIDAEVGATLQSLGDGRGSSLDLGIVRRMYKNRLTLLADYRDFYDNNKENIFKKIHAGVEYGLAIFVLRAGISAGYPSVGAGINAKLIDIDAAYYSNELSKAPGGEEEKRTVVQIKLGW